MGPSEFFFQTMSWEQHRRPPSRRHGTPLIRAETRANLMVRGSVFLLSYSAARDELVVGIARTGHLLKAHRAHDATHRHSTTSRPQVPPREYAVDASASKKRYFYHAEWHIRKMVVVGKATDTNHLYLSSTLQRKPPTPDLINNLDQQAASMKYSIVLSVMSTLAAAAPLAINNPPIVTIALIDEPTCKALNANFTQPPGTSTNNPIGPWMMEIPLDVMQDFSKKPQQIVEIDVQHITAGIESHGFEVMADDPAVVCDVGVAAANDILVKMGSGRTRVTNLEYAQVTSLYCYKRLSI